jgi:hypothetical protein
MASTYVNDLRLNEMATGDESGNWGVITNTNLELIAEAFSYGTEAITTNADTHATVIADGATDPGRSMYLKYTGTLDSACTITISPNTVSKLWFIENGTSGSQDIILSCGSGANITIPAGDTKVVYSDGAGSGAAFFDAFASLSVVDLKVQDDLTVTDAALVTGVLTTTATQVATGGITSGSDIISDTDSTDSLGSTGVRWLKGWFDTLTAGTLTVGSGSVTDSSGAISFGDENLTTTGIVTAAGTSVFTNLDISGDIDVDGTTNLDVVDIDGAVDMASTALVTGVLTTTAATVFNGGFASNAASTISTADNLDTLSLISTDADANSGPNLRLYRNSGSPADSDVLGHIQYEGRNDNSQDVVYSEILTLAADVSDGTEDAIVYIQSMVAGTVRERISILPGETVFNENSVDLDFRVESDNDANALFVQGSDGSVGIGTSSPTEKLSVVGGHVSVGDSTGVGGTEFLLEGYREIYNGDKYGNTSIRTTYNTGSNASDMLFYTASGSTNTDESVRIDSGGHLLVGKTSGTAGNLIETDGRISAGAGSAGQPTYNCEGDTDTGINLPESNRIQLITNGVEAMRVAANGFIGIGSTGATASVSGAAGPTVRIEGANPEIVFSDNSGTANQVSNYYLNSTLVWHCPQKTGGEGTVMTLVTTSGNFSVVGSLSKGSGSFKIDHPLESKTDTHHLVHSFIEGPQADLIYRGKVDLVAGSATANIDTVAGMTEGTFVALNREVQCFTTNESNWDAVKGSVSGNILTIESENSESTATISWLVIGERKDQHMYDTDWTDDDGKVMVEPLKTDEE